jgi:hypothetical protein
MAQTEISGKVVLKKFAQGSKSEHEAVFLETGRESYKLRRAGGNPFRDPELDQLVGKQITAKGTIQDYLFIIDQYVING